MIVVSPEATQELTVYPEQLSESVDEWFARSATFIAVHRIDGVWHVLVGAATNERAAAALTALSEVAALEDGLFVDVAEAE